jgi:hypothetical protein
LATWSRGPRHDCDSSPSLPFVDRASLVLPCCLYAHNATALRTNPRRREVRTPLAHFQSSCRFAFACLRKSTHRVRNSGCGDRDHARHESRRFAWRRPDDGLRVLPATNQIRPIYDRPATHAILGRINWAGYTIAVAAIFDRHRHTIGHVELTVSSTDAPAAGHGHPRVGSLAPGGLMIHWILVGLQVQLETFGNWPSSGLSNGLQP